MQEDNTDQPAFHAGFPNAAAEAADVPLDLNQLVVRHPTSTFYLRVGSNSWEGLGVNQGDILVIDRALEPKPSDLAVVTDGEGFGLTTIPASKHLSGDEIDIWGVVAWVIHQQRKGGK
jgi:DNA polymerase V